MSNEDEGQFSVAFGANSLRLNMEDLRRRNEAFMPDGEHAWVIDAVYALDDPETALDRMELGEENFVGVTDIHCLLCHAPYDKAIRHHKCPQVLP